MIGIQAVVLNGADIGRNCLVGAEAVVTEGQVFPDNSLILGAPARVARQLTEEQIAGLKRAAQSYVDRANATRQISYASGDMPRRGAALRHSKR